MSAPGPSPKVLKRSALHNSSVSELLSSQEAYHMEICEDPGTQRRRSERILKSYSPSLLPLRSLPRQDPFALSESIYDFMREREKVRQSYKLNVYRLFVKLPFRIIDLPLVTLNGKRKSLQLLAQLYSIGFKR